MKYVHEVIFFAYRQHVAFKLQVLTKNAQSLKHLLKIRGPLQISYLILSESNWKMKIEKSQVWDLWIVIFNFIRI